MNLYRIQKYSVAFNDVDLCLKVVGKGYRNLWTPHAEAYHHESKSRGRDDSPEKLERFQREIKYMRDTWGDALDHDPYYSPNLSKHHDDFSYRINPSLCFPMIDLSDSSEEGGG